MREHFRERERHSRSLEQSRDGNARFHLVGGGSDFREGLVSVFVSNLNPIVDSIGLWSIFKVFGQVRDVYISQKKNTNRSCFAFIRFETRDEAGRVAQKVNGMHVYGRPIVAKVAEYDWGKRRTNDRPSQSRGIGKDMG
ncbi:hypothetical protein Dsin_022076 [Dipteronia sinensis]|uniref:RRM domain-containing protein n=1 Tax=Dipteronia sinensis TaxID=43782 RepID=A0AAE0A257_9ROSI|nr:hypothetical protein Dsin_022076 [Dipteronia sinensis]